MKNWLKFSNIFPKNKSIYLQCVNAGERTKIAEKLTENISPIDYLCHPSKKIINELAHLENILGYSFKNKGLLYKALIHSSYVNESRIENLRHNERMEYLGDAVLGMILTEYLFRRYPNRWEGELSLMRSWLVSETTLASVAGIIGLSKYIFLSNGEDSTGGRERSALHADVLEALIGSIYLDGGCSQASRVVLHLFSDKLDVAEVEKERINCKNNLQFRMHSIYHAEPKYIVVRTSGPEHMKVFEVEVEHAGDVLGIGKGYTKKEATMNAAYDALLKLDELEKINETNS